MMVNEILKHPALLYAQDISQICQPLKKLNISYFAHVRVNNKKQFSAIASNPSFTEHYLKNKYYMFDIHMVDESKFGNFFVWDGIEFSGQSAKMCLEAAEFNIHNPFTLIQKNKNSIDYYHFANDCRNKQINQIYLANIDLLNLFISHFNEHLHQCKSLAKAHDLKFDLSADSKIIFEDDSIIFNRDDFVNSIYHKKNSKKLCIGNTILSKRQSEILRYVVQGKTLKQIAHILSLSPRTVGHYFDAIKIKLNVNSKSELIAKSIDIKSIKLREENSLQSHWHDDI